MVGRNTKTGQVNNAIHHQLGDRWYIAQDDPVALLRAESRARNPWIV
jgi:2-polyprenyl-6-hydroxyphenyl methylase/3-demethylubiquinone-9 3-methyltransferase